MMIVNVYKSKPWIINYLKFKLTNRGPLIVSDSPIHIMFLFVDHFEPKENAIDRSKQERRIRNWVERYPQLASRHRDSNGFHPRHTWFYLVEDWENIIQDAAYLKQLANLCYDGFGEVELHVHHGPPSPNCFSDVDDAGKLAELIEQLKDFFGQTGALITAEKVPRRVFGFIHGKWALDNSQGGLYCGVNNELKLLSRTGCYADFTMPSGDQSQSKKINCIYYAKSDPNKPKSYDSGVELKVGGEKVGDLMIFQGMIDIYLNHLDPSVEKSNIDCNDSPTMRRIDRWVKCNIHVAGQPRWIFVKVHTHGARDENFDTLLGNAADQMYSYLQEKYNDGRKFKLHYVTAREAYNIVKAAEAGEMGDPSQYRDYEIKPYANTRIKSNVLYSLESLTTNTCEMRIIEAHENTKLEFKELLLKELEGQIVESLNYAFNQNRRTITISLVGRGEAKCKIDIPRPDDKCNVWVKGAGVIKRGNLIEGQECWLSTNLEQGKLKRIFIQY